MKIFKFCYVLAVIPSALADFWLVYQRRFVQIGRIEFSLYGTTFVTETPQWTCEHDAFSHSIIPDQRNASGYKYGVEFEPWNSRPGPLWHDPLVTMKINTFSNILGLQTFDNDQGFTMVNHNNEVSAQCYLNRTFIIDLDCWFTHNDPRIDQFHVNINGSSMFFCESNQAMNADTYGSVELLQRRDSDMLVAEIPGLPPIIPCLGCEE
ncbi:hypothetical protein F5B22DRAFT_538314 [Xylaria bambusicola]|uniref:uncharacterized protein n=1 Tax=Xylaria bambusicola TaxID=326684 RepID=UPI0020089288|nr:uncharacterized protein F5B22DRAFT_538314 [Xylaria bambusicola]KAI0505122.1 hypothetical protein F5B22DRAFT_538314 [Xylaria bambusicola]